MSGTGVLLLTAFGGAALTLVGTFAARVRDAHAGRVAALAAVEHELSLACEQIAIALEGKLLWPSSIRMENGAWTRYRDVLAPMLDPKAWKDIQSLVVDLGLADRMAAELRDAQTAETERSATRITADVKSLRAVFYGHLEKLAKNIKDAQQVLKRGSRWTATRFRAGGVATVAVFGVAAAVVALLLTSGPLLTRDAIARDLERQFPAASRVVCDESTDTPGSYVCDAVFSNCAGQLTAATKPTPCESVAEAYDVATEGRCYIARLVEKRAEGKQSTPPGKFARLLIGLGCNKPK